MSTREGAFARVYYMRVHKHFVWRVCVYTRACMGSRVRLCILSACGCIRINAACMGMCVYVNIACVCVSGRSGTFSAGAGVCVSGHKLATRTNFYVFRPDHTRSSLPTLWRNSLTSTSPSRASSLYRRWHVSRTTRSGTTASKIYATTRKRRMPTLMQCCVACTACCQGANVRPTRRATVASLQCRDAGSYRTRRTCVLVGQNDVFVG